MLYHYTSIDKLKSILKTQQLWLTKISNFKDISEFKHTLSLIAKELLLPFNDLENALSQFSNNIFVSCFCEDFDRSYLWENYGEFNIGFSKTALNGMVGYQQRAYGYIKAYSNFLRCEYCLTRQKSFIEKAYSNCNNDIGYTIPVDALTHLATIYKKSEFCPEQETRLVLYLKDGSPIKTVGSVNYFVLPFRTDNDIHPIKSITVGPTYNFDNTERELRNVLDALEMNNIAINRSNISQQEFSNFKSLNTTKKCSECEQFFSNTKDMEE